MYTTVKCILFYGVTVELTTINSFTAPKTKNSARKIEAKTIRFCSAVKLRMQEILKGFHCFIFIHYKIMASSVMQVTNKTYAEVSTPVIYALTMSKQTIRQP